MVHVAYSILSSVVIKNVTVCMIKMRGSVKTAYCISCSWRYCGWWRVV